MIYKAKHVGTFNVIDPDSKGEVELSIYKHENGGMFAIDSSFIEQTFEDDIEAQIPDPFGDLSTIIDMVILND